MKKKSSGRFLIENGMCSQNKKKTVREGEEEREQKKRKTNKTTKIKPRTKKQNKKV
jgi:hypothetical protein